jgi:hypothetical protein
MKRPERELHIDEKEPKKEIRESFFWRCPICKAHGRTYSGDKFHLCGECASRGYQVRLQILKWVGLYR